MIGILVFRITYPLLANIHLFLLWILLSLYRYLEVNSWWHDSGTSSAFQLPTPPLEYIVPLLNSIFTADPLTENESIHLVLPLFIE
jgi:hypothetical protein